MRAAHASREPPVHSWSSSYSSYWGVKSQHFLEREGTRWGRRREKLDLESKQAVHSLLIYNVEEKVPVLQQQQNILISSGHSVQVWRCAAWMHLCMCFVPVWLWEYLQEKILTRVCVFLVFVLDFGGKINALLPHTQITSDRGAL